MKKIYLLLLVTLAIASFLFFTPIMLFILGLSCTGLGIVSLVNPQRMSFQIIHRASMVRLVGIAFIIGGIAASLGGGNLIYNLYLNNQPNKNALSTDGDHFKPNLSGGEAVRPVTNPSTTASTSNKKKNSLTKTIQTLSKPIDSKPTAHSSTSATTQHSSQTTSSTSPAPSTSTNTSNTTTTSKSTSGNAFGLSKKTNHPGKDHLRK
jgi:hypothetical protein